MSTYLDNAKRVVIKIGSSLLVDGDGLRQDWLTALAEDIRQLRGRGCDIIVVSSGAVALGASSLALGGRPQKLEEGQAAAAVGQIQLAHAWQNALAHHDITVAQILLTIEDTEQRRRYLNARRTIETLLRLDAIPVINENDTVATSELRYGDNDRLAARVAQMVSADVLLLLSDVAGLYSSDPSENADAELIGEVSEITDHIMAMAGEAKQMGMGSGGMVTKLLAARIATDAGCHMAILDGTTQHPIARFQETGTGTWFRARGNPRAARKQWIAGSVQPSGQLVVDDGAAKALKAGKSLLPAGVTAVTGSFERGDAVSIVNGGGAELGRGLVAYDTEDAKLIMGHKSQEIEALLGYRGRGELVHRDDLVLWDQKGELEA